MFDNFFKKPSSIAIGVLAIFMIAILVVVPRELARVKESKIRRASVGLIMNQNNKAAQLALFKKQAASINRSPLSFTSSHADDDDMEAICEGMGEVADYWLAVAMGQQDNPLPDLIAELRANIDDEDAIEEIMAEFLGGEIDFQGLYPVIENGEAREFNVEDFIAAFENVSPYRIFEAIMDGIEENCREPFDDDDQTGFGSSGGSFGERNY